MVHTQVPSLGTFWYGTTRMVLPTSLPYFPDVQKRYILMVETTKQNHEGYNNNKFAVPAEAQEGLFMVGNTQSNEYMNMVHSGRIYNCPVNPEAITVDNTFFYPDATYLIVKTTRKSYEPVVTQYVEIPQRILDLSNTVTLAADVMFSNVLVFFVSILR